MNVLLDDLGMMLNNCSLFVTCNKKLKLQFKQLKDVFEV